MEVARPPQQLKLSIVWGLSYKDYSWMDIERRRWLETREQLVNRGVSSKSSKSLLNSSARRDDAWSHSLAQSYRFPMFCSSLLSNYRSWPPCQGRLIFWQIIVSISDPMFSLVERGSRYCRTTFILYHVSEVVWFINSV